jgi:hypothetical protein
MRASDPTWSSVRSTLKVVRMVVAAALVAPALVAGVAVGMISPASATSKSQSCQTVSAGGQGYAVSATNVSCAFAQKWVAKLAGTRVKSHSVRSLLSHGPSGYTCYGGAAPPGSSVNGVNSNVQTNGSCRKGLLAVGDTPYFNWTNQKVLG